MRDHKTISIADQIFEQLENDILTGKYAKGEVLSELNLSSMLGVSRTPIREALKRLEQENIIADTGKGITVIGISYQDMLDMYDMRIHIEGLAAARAAEMISEDALKEMADVLDMQKYYIEKQETSGVDVSEKIKDADSRFHEVLYDNCGSSAFRDTLIHIHKKIIKYRKASVSKASRARVSYEEHLGIYNALCERDAEKCRTITEDHVRSARNRVKEMGDF